MAQTKYPLPDDLKMRCLSIVKGYDRMLRDYKKRKEEILLSCFIPEGTQLSGRRMSDEDFYKSQKLEELENRYDTFVMKAVKAALDNVGADLYDKNDKRRLRDAIWDSCTNGRSFVFEYRALPLGKTNFYERRRKFLYDIASELSYI